MRKFCPGQGVRQNNCPGWLGFARSKIFNGIAQGGGGGGGTQLELTETLAPKRLIKFHIFLGGGLSEGGAKDREGVN